MGQIKTEVVTATTAKSMESANNIDIETILWAVYFMGAAILLLLVIKELVAIVRLYKIGKKTICNGYMLIETGKSHSPFSLGRKLFITNKDHYKNEELSMVVAHELQHSKQYHLADKLMMTTARIVFWFHPLVHIYYKRLMIVHEYEADAPSKKQAKVYGSFLLEQNLLKSHSLITHSFNFSPLKNRIAMLTKKESSRIQLLKYAVMAPMLVVFMVCCTERIHSQEQITRVEDNNGLKVTYHIGSNEFEMKTDQYDTIEIEDPVTGKLHITTKEIPPYPYKMNGQKIHNKVGEASRLSTNDGSVGLFVFQKLKDEFEKLPDENYTITMEYVTDEKGQVVFSQPHYFQITLLEYQPTYYKSWNKVDQKTRTDLVAKINKVSYKQMEFSPALINNKPVIARFTHKMNFSVKNGMATYQ